MVRVGSACVSEKAGYPERLLKASSERRFSIGMGKRAVRCAAPSFARGCRQALHRQAGRWRVLPARRHGSGRQAGQRKEQMGAGAGGSAKGAQAVCAVRARGSVAVHGSVRSETCAGVVCVRV